MRAAYLLILAAASIVLPFGYVARAQDATTAIANSQVVTRQLPAGKSPQTFTLSYTGRVSFTQEAAFPVTVSITDWKRQLIASITVKDSSPFTITHDLAPGSYHVDSNVSPENDSRYWSALGPEVFIDPQGHVSVQTSPDGVVLVHEKKIKVLAPPPPPATESTVNESRPLLKWEALPGATSYKVDWLEEDAPQHVLHSSSGTTTATEFRVTEDLVPKRQYEWSVWAFDANGELGYWSAAYFFTPGGKDAFHKAGPAPVISASGMSYIGVRPIRLFDQNGKDATGGILVRSLAPDSPALKAGLQPQDVLTKFDGNDLSNVSTVDFVRLVRGIKPGTVVVVEYRRNGITGRTEVTVGAMP